jgi:sugar lactone lactonase YvrE
MPPTYVEVQPSKSDVVDQSRRLEYKGCLPKQPPPRSKNMKAAKPASLVAMLAAAAGNVLAQPAEIVIPGERLTTESLTSTRDGTVYIGSVGTGQIFRAQPGAATAAPFIAPKTNGIGAVFGVFADERAGTLWACSGTLALGPPQAGAPPPPPSALFAFDLKSGAPKGKWNMPAANAFCNDIAVGSDGTAYASDTNNMQIARLKPGAQAMETWAGADGAFGPAGGVLDGIAVLGNTVLVNALRTNKIFAVAIGSDGAAGKVTDVKLDTAVAGPDGMRSFGTSALLVAEGGGGGAVTKIVLNGALTEGTRTVLKSGFPDGPVGVTVVGESVYVLEGQLAALFAPPGSPAPPAKPYKATAVPVGKP